MYRALYDFAKSRGLTVAGNYGSRTIAAYIELDESGKFCGVSVRSKEQRKQKIVCPQTPKTNAMSPIAEKIRYIFPADASQDAKKHAEWMQLMEQGSDTSGTIRIIYQFVQSLADTDAQKTLFEQFDAAKLLPQDFVSFRIAGRNAEAETDWRKWFDEYSDDLRKANQKDGELIISCISGKPVVPIATSFPMIKAPQTGTGVPVFSCNHKYKSGNACAFRSYGEDAPTACPMSQEEVDTIRTGLEYLLQSPDNWNRTFGLVFWYDDPDAENLIEKVLNAENDEDYQLLMTEIEDHNVTLQSKDQMYQSGLNALMDGSGVRTGRIHACYHMMGVRFPAQGRFYLTNYTKDTYAHLKENIKRWYRDTALLNPYTGNDSSIVNLWSALFGLLDHPDAKDKQKEFQIEYGMDSDQFLKAVLSGGPLSFHMLMKASAHIEKEILNKKKEDWPLPRCLYLQIIKAYFIRKGDEEMGCMNYSGPHKVAHECGRLLACMDALQNAAMYQSGGVSGTVAKKYYKAFKRFPGRMISAVTENQEVYLSKIRAVNIRDKYALMLGDIAAKLGGDVPAQFTMEDQAAFDMGYFLQRAEFIRERQDAAQKKKEKEERVKEEE